MVYQQTKSILQQQGLAPHKKRGQNFLVHRHTAERIVDLAAPQPDDIIIEVGVGLGALTYPLAKRAKKVIGIESDSGLIRWHEQEGGLPENVELIHRDILKTDFAELANGSGGRLKIVANLPYSISSPFLFRLIEHRELMDWAVIMLQKEVAQRLLAEPGTKDYGVPTVLLAGCATVKPLLKVGSGEFHPRPKVDSLVVKLSFLPIPERVAALPAFDRKLFRKVVNGAFSQRRKTLRNALKSAFPAIDNKTMTQLINQAGLEESIRAERLSLEAFVRLTDTIDIYQAEGAARAAS
ncbi:MAG: 16S rRNA (adenine(1518)-N(6)/adenine(1519)-N(6))-dimethyltransferase RsmA [Desulfobulbaceae bacterium]|nr:16S rRNA (adenine(1518)-N(6)/adenine(1519)-N(6))-dimethyltransferase RsmA [Desulfobulbaceae bacterium]